MHLLRRSIILVLLILFSITLSSCKWQTRKWEALEDRTFYLAWFQFEQKGKSNEYAYAFMQSFPINKIVPQLEKKYKIKIDTSAFDAFLESGKPEKINSMGWSVLNRHFTWKIREKNKDYRSFIKDHNTIRIHYFRDEDFDTDKITEDYNIELRVNNRIAEAFMAQVRNMEEVPEDLAEQLKKIESIDPTVPGNPPKI